MIHPEMPDIFVLYGGDGPERSISIKSGQSVAESIRKVMPVQELDLTEPILPESIRPERSIVFPVFHGGFGEDGTLQALMEARGICYVGNDPKASQICMYKNLAKSIFRAHQIPTPLDVVLDVPDEVTTPATVTRYLGSSLIVKPVNGGSSVDLKFVESLSALTRLMGKLNPGRWLVEERIRGREFSVGIFRNQAMEIIEILPESGTYDFKHKYTPGLTQFECPAHFPEKVSEAIRALALRAFIACGCRDLGRVDGILSESGEIFFLEINTLPGLSDSECSLLPRGVKTTLGISYDAMIYELLHLAFQRYQAHWRSYPVQRTPLPWPFPAASPSRMPKPLAVS